MTTVDLAPEISEEMSSKAAPSANEGGRRHGGRGLATPGSARTRAATFSDGCTFNCDRKRARFRRRHSERNEVSYA